MAEQDEDQQHARGFIELLAFEEECRADTEEVAGADAQHHQHRHVEHAVSQGAPGGDDERPDRIEDRGARKEEHRNVFAEPERRQEPWLAHAHGLHCKDG